MNFRRKLLKLLILVIVTWNCSPCSAQDFSVLHYTETSGFNHQTASVSMAMFEDLGLANGFTVVQDSTGSHFNSLAKLQDFAVVIFSNTSGNNILNANQRANFEAYIQNGGSFIGIHAAADTYRHSSANGNSTGTWDWYAETVCGCSVQQNPNHTSANHNNDNTHSLPGHPVLDSLPDPWNKTEEYYYWENGYLAPSFLEALQVGQTGNQSYDEPRMTATLRDLPGGGRAFYTSLGHSTSNFTSDQNFIRLLENAVIWTAKRNSAVTPDEFSIFRGVFVSGALGDVLASDDNYLRMQPGFTLNSAEAPVWLVFEGTAIGASSFFTESSAGTPGLNATTEAFDWTTQNFDVIGMDVETFNSDSVIQYDIDAVHIDSDGSVRARVGWRRVGFTINFPWEVAIDQVGWNQ